MKSPLITFGVALSLAACSTAPAPTPIAEPAPPPEPVVETPAIEPAPEPEPLIVDLGRLQNQTPADVVAYLGAPTLVRRDDNVQIMIFEAERCVVEVIFYEPDNGDYFRAEWLNARLRTGQDTDVETCTRQWLEETLPQQ